MGLRTGCDSVYVGLRLDNNSKKNLPQILHIIPISRPRIAPSKFCSAEACFGFRMFPRFDDN